MSSAMSGEHQPERIFQEQEFPVLVVIAHSRNHTRFDTNSHPELEFHLIRRGASQYFIDGINYPCEKNSVLIMHENEEHAWLLDQEHSDKNMSLLFDPKVLAGREISNMALERLASVHHLILPDSQANNVEFLFNSIAEECKYRQLNWEDIVIEYVETFLTTLYRAAERQASMLEGNDLLIQNVIDYVEGRLTEKISLEELSQRFGVSYSVLSKKFKQHMGLGFREYLIRRRIATAQKMLEETDLKVAAIASKVGFDSLTTFNRDFRMLTGVTPAVYRTISDVPEPER